MSFGPETMATLAALARFAVAMVAGADHEARSLRERGLAGFAVVAAMRADHEARSLRSHRSLRSPAPIQ